MKLNRLKTADEMEREYARRLQRCTLHNHIVLIGAVILFGILLWASFQGPTDPSGTGEDVYAADFPF